MAEAQVTPEPPVDVPVVKRESRSLNCLTIAEKDSLCKFKQQNPTISNSQLKSFAKEKFDKEPSSSQISRILQEPDKWAVRESRAGARKVRNGKWPALEAALTLIFAQERQAAQTVTASTILKKAREIAPELGIKDFTGSNTWAENFRARTSFLDARAPTMTQSLIAPPDAAAAQALPPVSDIDIAAVRQEIMARLEPNAAPAAQQPLVMTEALAPAGAAMSVNLEEAHHAAFVVASFMEQNPDKFPISEQLTFERDIRAKLSKHLIDKMKQDKS